MYGYRPNGKLCYQACIHSSLLPGYVIITFAVSYSSIKDGNKATLLRVLAAGVFSIYYKKIIGIFVDRKNIGKGVLRMT